MPIKMLLDREKDYPQHLRRGDIIVFYHLVPKARELRCGNLASRYYCINGEKEDDHFEAIREILGEELVDEIGGLRQKLASQTQNFRYARKFDFEFFEPSTYNSELTLQSDGKRRKLALDIFDEFEPSFVSLKSLKPQQMENVCLDAVCVAVCWGSFCFLMDGSGPTIHCYIPYAKNLARIKEGFELLGKSQKHVWIAIENASSGPVQSDTGDDFHLEVFLRSDTKVTLLSERNPLVVQRMEYFRAVNTGIDLRMRPSLLLESAHSAKWQCVNCHCSTYISKQRCYSCRKHFNALEDLILN